VLTLAIGILGNTTIFSGVNALLFTPLPTERPEQIAQIEPDGHRGWKLPLKLYTDLRDHNSSFVALAAVRHVTVSINDTAQAARSGQSRRAWPSDARLPCRPCGPVSCPRSSPEKAVAARAHAA
jgi:hypothetical protein